MCLKGCIELSVAMTSFVRQLQATDKFLGQIACLSTAADVQRQRVKILVDIIPHRGPWTSDACSFACEAVNSCQNLTKENKEALLQSICQLVDDEIEAGSRVKLQDYTNVVNMLPQDLSGLLMEETMPIEDKLLRLCHHCHSLGLLYPSEKTCSVLTCLVYWCHWQHCMPDVKHKNWYLNQTKPMIKQYLQHCQNISSLSPERQLRRLPMKVDELPMHYKQLIEQCGPLVAVSLHCKTTCEDMPTRVTKRGVKFNTSLVKPLPPPRGNSVQAQHALALDMDAAFNVEAAVTRPAALLDKEKGALEKEVTMASDPLPLKDRISAQLVKEQKSLVGRCPNLVMSKPKNGKASVFETLANLKLKLQSKKEGTEIPKPEQEKIPQKPAHVAKAKPGPKASSKKAKQMETSDEPVEKHTTEKSRSKKAAISKKVEEQELQPVVVDLKHKNEKLAPKKSAKQKSPNKVAKPSPKKKVQKRREPKPLPEWWNCKEKLLARFPQDTPKRFSSRCYHHIVQNEVLKGVMHEMAKLAGQRAHAEALIRWSKMFPA